MAAAFVILFEGRTGSTHLTTLLDSHPRVRAQREVLGGLKTRNEGSAAQLIWADGALTTPADGSLDAVGFKTKLRDVIDKDSFAELLLRHEARVIHLERNNVVKQALSGINAQKLARATGRYNLFDEANRLPPQQIDPKELHENLLRREQWQRDLHEFLVRHAMPTLHVTYERLLAGEEDAVGDVLQFLGVRPAPLRSPILKATSDNLRDAVLNFDELVAHFAGTPYEAMFSEVSE